MIVTLSGGNSFGWQRELRQLVDAFVIEHSDLALQRIDGQEASYEQILEALTCLPFLSDRKMVVIRDLGSNKRFVEEIEHIFADLPETTDLILVEPKLDKRLSYYKFLKKGTDFRNFAELDSNGLSRWLADTAKQQSGSINQADARYLLERVGAHQQLLSNELEKLLLYDPKITRHTIDLLTEPAPQSTIFQLLEAAFAGNHNRALKLYAEQRALKVEPGQIVAMLAWQLRVLALIKTAGDRGSDQVAKEAKMSPYVVSKSQAIARNLTLRQLKKLISDLLTIDLKTKTTSIDSDEALQHYLLNLSR